MNSKAIIEELSRLILLKDDGLPPATVDILSRQLRPVSSSLNNHNTAIKQRIKQAILNNTNNGDGMHTVSQFENECSIIRRLNSSLLLPFLALYEPLCYPVEKKKYFSRPTDHININPNINNNNVNKEKVSKPVMPLLPVQYMSDTDRAAVEAGIGWISPDAENKLLRDLLYIFQGIGGKYIKFDPRSECYLIDPALRVRPQVRDTTLCLCELGYLYNKVAIYIQRAEGIDSSKGLVVQAFGFALQEELHDYYRLLAVLEQELMRKIANDNNEIEDDDGGTSGLTLLRLRAWMHEPLDRMYLMARLVESAGPLTGGALASRLHGHAQHGDPQVRIIVQRIMDSVSSPLYVMMTRWILHGDINDPFQEFFIGVRQGVNPNRIWQDVYFLRTGLMPSFLSTNLANKILVIGKSINFIRGCMPKLINSKENDNEKSKKLKTGMAKPSMADALGYGYSEAVTSYNVVDDKMKIESDTSGKLYKGGERVDSKKNEDSLLDMTELDTNLIAAGTEIEESLNALRYGGELRLSELVAKIGAATDTKLLNLMINRFNLKTHLLALRKFMLLSQGDFVTCLMDLVAPELKKRATQLYRHNLTGMLEGALRSSNAQFEPAFVLDRIGVRLLEASAGDSGWETFSLDYALDAPLNAVVHLDAIAKYRTAFHMLWRLQRVQWSLSSSWKQQMSFTHAKGDETLSKLKPVLHRCNLNRGRMLHVVNNLCQFLMFEVMESAWATLQQGLDQAKCLDDVIHAHDLYLNEILERALLSVHHDALNMQVQQMLQSILRFCALEETLLADATAAMTRRLILQKEVEDRTAKGGWGLSDKNLEDASGTFDGVPAYLVTRLDESVKDYSIQFDILMSMLKDQGEKAGEMVRFLTFRLDYNEFYQEQKKIGANIALTSTPPVLPPQQPVQSRARDVGQTRLFTDKSSKRK